MIGNEMNVSRMYWIQKNLCVSFKGRNDTGNGTEI